MGCLGSTANLIKGAQYEYLEYLNKVPTLAPLLKEEQAAIAAALVEMHFTQGECVYEQGELGNTFYILYEGAVVVTKDRVKTAKLTATSALDSAHFFGEQALFSDEEQSVEVKVCSEIAKILALDRDTFNAVLGPFDELISKKSDERIASLRDKKKTPLFNRKNAKIPHDCFIKKERFCQDNAGVIDIVTQRTTGEIFALKGMNKDYIVKYQLQKRVMNERDIHLMVDSQFIMKLHECYNKASVLYFLLEPALGGELFEVLRAFRGSTKHATYYSASVACAFEHLHKRHIIYRNLKPENLLFNEHGQLKLTGFAIAKFVIGKTYTICGSTPDYYAPEMIAATGHTVAADWWMFGVLLFELMSGYPPFQADNDLDVYLRINNGIAEVPFPAECKGPLSHLIKSLLTTVPQERLPMRPRGIRNLINHDWYTASAFDWVALKEGTLTPPYTPEIRKQKSNAMTEISECENDGGEWDQRFST